MSTRCQIEFNTPGGRRTVYQHSDGYPEGIESELRKFLKWNEGRNMDVEYCTANFIYWAKRKYEALYFDPKKDGERNMWCDVGSTSCSPLHIGFGVCENDKFHGDIEWFYVVEIRGEQKEDINIYAYKHGVELKERKEEDKITIENQIKIEEMDRVV